MALTSPPSLSPSSLPSAAAVKARDLSAADQLGDALTRKALIPDGVTDDDSLLAERSLEEEEDYSHWLAARAVAEGGEDEHEREWQAGLGLVST